MATEKRLIDANEYKMAIEKMLADAYAAHDWGYESILEDCIWELDAQTTVDAVEVVHGRWEVYPDWRWLRCTNCRAEFEQTHFPQTRHYCPNCGADMRDGAGNA